MTDDMPMLSIINDVKAIPITDTRLFPGCVRGKTEFFVMVIQ